MATIKPDLTRIWAAGAPGVNVEDPDTTSPGKFDQGWVAEVPTFENFNFLQQLFTQGLLYLSEQGLGVYDAITDYPVEAITKGSDGNIYSALIINGPATTVVDPVGDTTSTWKPTALLEQLLVSTLTHDMGSDANYTLSVSENYKAILEITDTGVLLTGGVDIEVNDIGRLFYAINNTAQDLVFKTVSGTGVTVVSGSSALLLNDETNVIDPLTIVDASETVKGVVELATQAEVDAGSDNSRSVVPSTLANSPQVSKAYINFNGTGTVAIRASFNVSSLTDNGTGLYTVNFTNAMAAATYTALVTGMQNSAAPRWAGPSSYAVGSVQIDTEDSSGINIDHEFVNASIFEN